MEEFKKYIFYMLIVELVMLVAAKAINTHGWLNLTFINIMGLSLAFFAIIATSLFVFFRGQQRDAESQGRHLMLAFSLKFLLELVLVFFWFFVFKKNSIEFLLSFFVVYLAFTIFLMYVTLKTLKKKNL